MLKFKVLLLQIHVSAGEDPGKTRTVELPVHQLEEKVNTKYVLEKRSWGAEGVQHCTH